MRSISLWAAVSLIALGMGHSGWAADDAPKTTDVVQTQAMDASDASDTIWTAFIDSYYGYNFNKPPRKIVGTNPQSENRYRVFDTKEDSLTLSLLQVDLTQKAKPLGFRAVLDLGETAKAVNFAEPQSSKFWKHMEQLYLTYDFNGGAGTNTLDFGKFVTNAGAEVIESPANWNYTRGILFGWAIPFYHAGFRFTHHMNDSRWVSASLINGWNDVRDNNSKRAIGLSYNTPIGSSNLLVNYYGGDEPTSVSTEEMRNLLDVVWSLSPKDSKWSYMVNVDYAKQNNATVGNDATWYGVAGYAKYVISDTTNWAARVETFRDKDGFATGVDQTLGSGTLTFDYHPGQKWIHRVELRHDWSNKDVFDDQNGLPTKSGLSTVTVGSVYKF